MRIAFPGLTSLVDDEWSFDSSLAGICEQSDIITCHYIYSALSYTLTIKSTSTVFYSTKRRYANYSQAVRKQVNYFLKMLSISN